MIYGIYWTQIICRFLEGFQNVFHAFQNLPDGFLPLPTFPWYLEEWCLLLRKWVVTYLLAISHSPTPPPNQPPGDCTGIRTYVHIGFCRASMIFSKSRTSERVHHESRCIYCIYIYIYLFFLVFKEKHVTLQEDQQEDTAKTKAPLNYNTTKEPGHSPCTLSKRSMKTWPGTYSEMTIVGSVNWYLSGLRKSTQFPLRRLKIVSYLSLCLCHVWFLLFSQDGSHLMTRTHTQTPPLFDSANGPAKECFLANSLNLETSARDSDFFSWLGR